MEEERAEESTAEEGTAEENNPQEGLEEKPVVKKGNKFLKITGILMILGGSFAVVASVFIMIFGAFLVAGNIHSPGVIVTEIGSFLQSGIALTVLGGVIQFITGVLGVKNAKKPEKANICIIFGTITAILFIATQVIHSTGSGDISTHYTNISILLGLVVPALYLIGAVSLKEAGVREKIRIPGKAIIAAFYIKRKETIFEILFTFILCGIIGWAFETIEVWIHLGNLTTRGIFFISMVGGFPIIWGLPYILMYGIGGAILIWCFKPLKNEPVRLFIIGMLVLTIFEYATSVLCENLFHVTLWDYSNMFMNFQGRVCLRSSLAWGVLSVISVKLLAPLFHKLYNKIELRFHIHAVTIILLIYIVTCYILRGVLDLNH